MRSWEKRWERKRSGDGGFTLVELLVVIAILGILAAIVVFAVGGITDKGQTSANQTDCSVLESAEEAYFAKNGAYTGNEADLVTAGFLHQVSTLHPAVVLGGGSYTITGC
jgi:general secretion pathway protein G